MGIRELKRYINEIGTLWTSIDLQNTKLVIDGSSLSHHLYANEDFQFDWRCGGQYDEFYRVVLSFCDTLISNGVEPYVIIDGADDPSDKKMETLEERALDRIKTSSEALSKSANDKLFLRPLLLELVFLQALRNRGVEFAVCDSEADMEIASLARAWNCPVLSNDSDFFIFDIEAGYIPLYFLNWNSDHLTARIFFRRKLASYFPIRAELIPLFASLAGNDYVDTGTLTEFNRALNRFKTWSSFGKRGAEFAGIAYMLSRLPDSSTEEEALEHTLQMVQSPESRNQLKRKVKNSLEAYTITKSNLLRYFQEKNGVITSSLKTQNGREIDEWLLRKFREGYFSSTCMSGLTVGKFLLGSLVENCREISANRCCLKLRRCVYGILNVAATHEAEGNLTRVQEWDREGMTVKPSNVAPYQGREVPSLNCMQNPDDKEPRLTYLLFALDLDTSTTHIKYLPDELKLIVGSLRFLITNAQPMIEINHLLALLCCYVNLQEDSVEQKEKSASRRRFTQPFDVRAAQSFAQWQCVLRDAIDLNATLHEPLPTPCIHKTFNGKLAHSLRERLDQGRTPEQLIPFGLDLFDRLKSAVISGLLEKISTNVKDDGKKTIKKKSNAALSTDVPLTNRFAPLDDIGEQES